MPEITGALIGLMTVFLLFVATILAGQDSGECPYCDHCRELRGSRFTGDLIPR
jgi:hypothetical protein